MTADDQQIPSVWTRPSRGRREQPALSRGQIVSEAIRLLDAEGIDALSMRKLGTRLGAGATSLYRHVANKDELLELVVDEIYGESTVPDSSDPAGWRAATITCAHSVRAMILRHPWVATLLGAAGTVYLGPNFMRWSEGMLTLLEGAGFSLARANSATTTVFAYVIGMTINEAAALTMITRSGYTEQQWAERLGPAIQEAVQSYPRLRELYELYAGQGQGDPEQPGEDEFDYGLNRILDGLQVSLDRAGG